MRVHSTNNAVAVLRVAVLRVAVLPILCLGTIFCVSASESVLGRKITREIHKQLAQKKPNRIERKIASYVGKEINNQVNAKLRAHTKKKVYNPDPVYDVIDGSMPFVYKVPKWPVRSLFFFKKDTVGLFFNATGATQSYGAGGGTKDVSHLLFQEEPIYVKDILLASKLIDCGLATPSTKYKFLETLKDQLLCFDASMNRQELGLSYIRHFLRGDIALGFYIPFVRKEHKLKLTSSLSALTTQNLQNDGSDFFTLYPDGLIDFFREILGKKNITFSECGSCQSNDVEFGLGDVEAFFNFEIISKSVERFFVGLHALFPTSRRRDVYALWDPEFGNGGFGHLSLFTSVLYAGSRFFNPHLFVQGTYAFPATVFRRVPRLRRTQDVQSNVASRYGDDFTPYGNSIAYSGSVPDFCLLDATVRRFSDTARKIKIRRGSEFFARIGNMIDRAFFKRMFVDLFYDFWVKGKDYTGFRRPESTYNPSVLTKNSDEIAHRFGCNVSYQFDNSWRLHLGGRYTFAGRNTLKTYEIEGAVTLEF